ncbi:uncharacterized protein SPPG_09387 [Spizellomyces punctatus DAOM BR117]|uniref:Uncharacterized protein n=1 Tax=Spizellomyces punctatus (strain DAOM BR117) TaxID=645134 RepID=A0A0L0HAB1_SPIPD|nr:uncharacterized protein SPPG_09387 [Spizellomyces punctatus DAOM BR117]KNC98087.1 hypothetical protein SPPG_09387 [Spizellomyces punctatus DAOM BR117]|eukprot:XP_016606127.1 hypothetical protein SPPG_09387 [Spizellomyces punctatus DAOM BR117]
MPGPAPFILAAGAAGAAAAMYLTHQPQESGQHATGALTSIGAGLLPTKSSPSSPGLQTRPVSFRRHSETSLSYGDEQRWAREAGRTK